MKLPWLWLLFMQGQMCMELQAGRRESKTNEYEHGNGKKQRCDLDYVSMVFCVGLSRLPCLKLWVMATMADKGASNLCLVVCPSFGV